MKTKIVSNAEIKKILGIGGSSQDALINIWNGAATEILCNFLGVSELASHTVTDERVRVLDGHRLMVEDFPVDTSVTPTLKDCLENSITGYTFDMDPQNRRTLRPKNTSGVPTLIGHGEVLISYTAGYQTKDTVTVLDYATLASSGLTIVVTVAGAETTYTFQSGVSSGTNIQAITDNDTTAAEIASVLGGTSSGAVVTLPLGTRVVLGTATTSELTISNADVPEDLKALVALIAGAGFQEKSKKGGTLNSYSIGGKTVNFRNEPEKSTAMMLLEKWAGYYKKTRISSI